ncbi:hypothetical protein AOQ84DRAFT_88719 [Glonium stellatum]|uniref:Uncharacterized protein n=1 Tax=Glonium stellatum TaxID=574774 RepID=A0A8E2FAT0_9PEZI|nr:hypothetical protein AOQ84DRAFT_88719 [Glonium stellatum]
MTSALGGPVNPNSGESDNPDRGPPQSTNKPYMITSIIVHSYTAISPATPICLNCHPTKTSSRWRWSRLEKDSRLYEHCYQHEKRARRPKPFIPPISGRKRWEICERICNNYRTSHIVRWPLIRHRRLWFCSPCCYKAMHHISSSFMESAENLWRPRNPKNPSSSHQRNELSTVHMPP